MASGAIRNFYLFIFLFILTDNNNIIIIYIRCGITERTV